MPPHILGSTKIIQLPFCQPVSGWHAHLRSHANAMYLECTKGIMNMCFEMLGVHGTPCSFTLTDMAAKLD